MPELVKSDEVVLKGLFVAEPGAGKTSILATANDCPELAPVCFLDFEGGTLAVQHRGDVYRERIKSMAQLDAVFWKLANKKEGWAGFKTIAIDSGSEMADLCLQEIVGEAFTKASSNSELAARDSIDDVQLKDYGKSTRRSTRIFRWFRDLDGVNVLMTALPKAVFPQAPPGATKEDKDRFQNNVRLGLIQPARIMPSFTDKLGTSVLGFLDFAWFLNISPVKGGGTERELLTQPVGPFRFIKTRNPRAAEVFGNGMAVAFENGRPTINGKPAMQTIYEGFAAGVKT